MAVKLLSHHFISSRIKFKFLMVVCGYLHTWAFVIPPQLSKPVLRGSLDELCCAHCWDRCCAHLDGALGSHSNRGRAVLFPWVEWAGLWPSVAPASCTGFMVDFPSCLLSPGRRDIFSTLALTLPFGVDLFPEVSLAVGAAWASGQLYKPSAHVFRAVSSHELLGGCTP